MRDPSAGPPPSAAEADGFLEAILRRDRLVVAGALGILAMLAWTYVIWLAADMDMGGMDMSGRRMVPAGIGLMLPARAPWSAVELALVFAMWAVMMVGMMAPAAAPMILLYARVGRQGKTAGRPYAATGWFATGYFMAWTGFSLVATIVQWGLERQALLDPRMASASNTVAAVVLLAAGVYQWTPLKDVCLAQCQSPLGFLMRHGGFRGDAAGCMMLGLRHGVYCVGCCWALMALLFVVGVMNVLWIALLALLVLVEKLTPWGRWAARAAGVACIAAAWAVGSGATPQLAVGLNPTRDAEPNVRTTLQMSITLPMEMAEAVKSKVAAGEYATESEVIRDGLRALLARDRAVERWLCEEVAAAYDAVTADPSRTVSAAHVRARIATEHARKVSKA